MYSAIRKLGKGNLVLIYSVPNDSSDFRDINVLSGGTQRHALVYCHSEETRLIDHQE